MVSSPDPHDPSEEEVLAELELLAALFLARPARLQESEKSSKSPREVPGRAYNGLLAPKPQIR